MSSLVSKVTTDDTNPIPMYVLKEIADLTKNSVKDVETIRSALVNRLGKSSPDVKFKALRAIKYVCSNGRVDFKLAFQRDSAIVKQLLSFQCPPDEMRGDKPAENVRTEAQECLEAIFADNTTVQQSVQVESFGNQHQYNQNQQPMTMGGGGSYGGFGTAPPKRQEDSITGFNIRRTIASAVLGDGPPLGGSNNNNNNYGSRPYVPTQTTNSKYGGLASNQYTNSTYSHYTHTPQQQKPSGGSTSTPGYSQNGLYGGGGNAQNYQNAQAHGYNTYNQHHQVAQSSSGGGFGSKAGPWGSGGTNQPNNQSSPQNHTQYHNTPSQPHQQTAPNEHYTARNGPTTKNAVQELGFEKRIVAQFTSNTPLKPTLTEVELKRFTQDSSACAVDDILMILHETFISTATQPASAAKALQLFYHIVAACGMVSQECDKEHIDDIQNLYTNSTNKHVKSQAQKVLIYFELLDPSAVDNTNVAGSGVSGFVAAPVAAAAPAPSQQQQAAPAPQQQPKVNNDPFALFNDNNTTNTTQNNSLESSFGLLNVNEQPQQPAKATGGMFGNAQIKTKPAQNNTVTSPSAFDFMDSTSPTPAPATAPSTQGNSNDLFALLGTSTTTTKTNSLDLDSLYASSAPQQPQTQTTQSNTTDNAFDFMNAGSGGGSGNGNDDIFGDLLSPQAPKQQEQAPPPQQQVSKPVDMSSFDFVDSFM